MNNVWLNTHGTWLNWLKRPLQGYQRHSVGHQAARAAQQFPQAYVATHDRLVAEVAESALVHKDALASMEKVAPALSTSYCHRKRCFDLAVGLLGSVLVLLLFPLIAFAIKLDSSGPVFYTQCRLGKDGKPFQIVKFRTMVQNAEAQTGAVWAAKRDPRITVVGDFLRRTKLDELPQLFNVVKGDMSIVGPRPERAEFTDKFAEVMPAFRKRLLVKPGITGVAQLRNGADSSGHSTYRKLRLDMAYIRTACMAGDLRIVMETYVAFLRGCL